MTYMAIQFARLEYVSRSQGKNACCKAAYNSRSQIKDERTNIVYNFQRIQDNVYHELILPANVNSKFKDLATFTNTIERTERRKDSQLLKEFVIALPDNKELSIEDRIELIKRFIEVKQFVKEGLGVQLDIHKPHSNENNWHAHILTTTRRFKEDGLGFGLKARDLDVTVKGGENYYVEKEKASIGDLWKDIQNAYFEEKGLHIKVDIISKTPGIHLGPVRMRGLMNEATQFHEDRIAAKNQQLPETPDELLDQVTYMKAVFTKEDLLEETNKDEMKGDLSVVAAALKSERIVELYDAEGSKTNFLTTKEVRSEEERILRIAERLSAKSIGDLHYQDTKRNIQTMVSNKELTNHQAIAITNLLVTRGLSGISFLRGRAGTGKSHVLSKLKTLTEGRYTVIGLAPTHKAKVGLENVGYENTDTVKGFLFKYKNNRVTVNNKTLLVIDEAGMIGTSAYLELLKAIYSSGAYAVFAGCERQLTSYERGGMFPVLADKYGVATLTETMRQKTPWGREVAIAFAEGNIRTGVSILQENGRLYFSKDLESSMCRLLEDWTQSKEALPNRLIISIANKNVDALNAGVHEILKEQGIVQGPEYKVESTKAKGLFAVGDRVLFIETNKSIGANNGDFGSIVEASLSKFKVMADNGKLMEFNPHDVKFKHGYAANIYKSQGDSIKDVYVLHSGFSNLRNSYVKMSRHINDLRLYCNSVSTKNQGYLIKQLARTDNTDASLWYKSARDLERSEITKNNNVLQKVGTWVKDTKVYLSDVFHTNEDYYTFEKEQVGNIKVEEILSDANKEYQKAVGNDQNFIYVGDYAANQSEREINNTEKNNNGMQSTTTLGSGKEGNMAQTEKEQSPLENKQGNNTWNDNLARTRQSLKFSAERVALSLLGEPNNTLSSKNTLRFGEHGKLAVEIRGNKAGIWYDFAAGSGGDLLALIKRELNVDFKAAVAEANKLLGEQINVDTVAEKILQEHIKEITTREHTDKLQKLYGSSTDIKGVVQKYLTEVRGINHKVTGDVRMVENLWHSNAREKLPALVGFARSQQGEITGAQAVYLNRETSDKADVMPAKRSFEVITGSYVEVQKARIGVILLAEGLETALSIKEAEIPGKILCTLGVNNLKNYPAIKGENIIICADNDGENSVTAKTVNEAVEQLREQGALVLVVKPHDKGDFNDVLKTEGTAAIQEQIMPHVEKVLDKTWLEIWENKATYRTNKTELLKEPTAEHALKVQNHAIQNTTKEINEFMVANKKELEIVKNFAPDYNLEAFKESLKGLDKSEMSTLLHDIQFATFKEYAINTMTKLQQDKLATKTTDEFVKVCEQEKMFCVNTDKRYSNLLSELEYQGYEKISSELTRYEMKPTLIEDFKRDATNAMTWDPYSSKPLLEQAKEISLYTAQRQLFDVCREHVVDQTKHELHYLKEHGQLKKDDNIYKTEKDYLKDLLADQTLLPYLKESKYERIFEKLKLQELQLEQQRSQDRGDSR